MWNKRGAGVSAVRVAVLLFCLIPAFARAQDDLKKAEQLFEDLQYEQALRQVEETLKSPRRGPSELVAAYRIKGLSLSALGRTRKALEAFRMLLAIDPDYQLKGVKSPKLNAPFFQAAGMTKQQGGIVLEHQPPRSGPSLAGLVLAIELKSDPMNMVRKVRMRFWPEGKKPLQMSLEVKGPRIVKMRLPLDFKDKQVNYYFEAVNAYGGVLARRGSAYQPLQIKARPGGASAQVAKQPDNGKPLIVKATPVEIPPPELPPSKENGTKAWYQSWWFWTAVGVVVVGAATGTALALSGDDGGGPVDVFINFGVR